MKDVRESTVVFVDQVHLYPASHRLLRLVQSGDWAAVESTLALMPVPERAAAFRHVVWADPSMVVPPVDLTTPGGRLVAVLEAHRLTAAAWRARTASVASQVSDQQWEKFRTLLCEAESLLIDVVAHDRGCVDAWDARLRTSRGLGLGVVETRRRYDHVATIEPLHLPAQRDLLQDLCPKWHGTWEAAFEFAREATRDAPEGSLQGALLVEAHLEGWIEQGANYLRQQSVIDEVDWAAQRSVLHPETSRGPGWLDAHSMFAHFYSLCLRPQQARWHFDVLGDSPVEATWAYFDDPAEQYAIWRGKARSGGRGR